MVTELLQKYIWLVQTFIRAGERGLTLKEISDKWEARFDNPYSRRTFNNHRKDVEDVFGIYIDCDRSTNRYFIEYSEDIADENAESAWLINTFTVGKMLSLGKERLSGRVAVENIPSGQKHLTSIMEAMTEGRVLEIEYRKYTSTSPETLTVHPYAVKESAKRWYLIGYCVERDALRVYGLDRVRTLRITEADFTAPKGFDVDELFATSFGIYLPDGRETKVTFRTSAKEAQYLRDLPLHSSQCEESSDGDNVTFSIFVCTKDSKGNIYRDLIMELCRYGSRIEVLSPADIRDAVWQEFKKAENIYQIK